MRRDREEWSDACEFGVGWLIGDVMKRAFGRRGLLFLAAVVTAVGGIGAVGGVGAGAVGTPFVKGDVFAGLGRGHIKEYSPAGVLRRTLDTKTACNEDLGMAFDASGGLFATASFGCAATVVHFDNTGNLLGAQFGSGYSSSTESITLDKAGDVYVGEPDGTHAILKFDKTGKQLGSFVPTILDRGTDWIDLAADQCTMYYASEGTAVHRFNVCTNKQLTDFATGLQGDCFALRIRPNGEVMIACSNLVYRLSSTGTVIQTYPKPSSDGSFLFALNLDPDGTSFWTAGYSSADVYRFDIKTGNKIGGFTAVKDGCCLSGLAVAGEIRVGGPATTTTTTTTTTVPVTAASVPPTTVPVTAASVPPTTVMAQAQLPRTGSHSSTMALIGLALVASGSAFTLTASRKRRHKTIGS